VTGRLGRRRRKQLDDLKDRRGYSHLKEEALDLTIWRAGFERGFGPVVRQSAKSMNDPNISYIFSFGKKMYGSKYSLLIELCIALSYVHYTLSPTTQKYNVIFSGSHILSTWRTVLHIIN
jgi:hypothetical protein